MTDSGLGQPMALLLCTGHTIICAMARPREFDIDKARDEAMRLFWRQGYQATVLPQLLEAMGIGRSSFYAAFGDKRALFVSCLDLFAERTLQRLANARAQHAPVDALQAFLERHVQAAGRQEARLGCLLVNSVLEMADVDPELSVHASRHLDRVEEAFDAALRDAGCAAERSRPLAQMLMLFNEGVRVASRRRLGARAQQDAIATTFHLLRQHLSAQPGVGTPRGRTRAVLI